MGSPSIACIGIIGKQVWTFLLIYIHLLTSWLQQPPPAKEQFAAHVPLWATCKRSAWVLIYIKLKSRYLWYATTTHIRGSGPWSPPRLGRKTLNLRVVDQHWSQIRHSRGPWRENSGAFIRAWATSTCCRAAGFRFKAGMRILVAQFMYRLCWYFGPGIPSVTNSICKTTAEPFLQPRR